MQQLQKYLLSASLSMEALFQKVLVSVALKLISILFFE